MALLRLVHTCRARRYDTCAKEFSNIAKFTIVETLDDGNCFFDTLSKAGKYYEIPALSYTHTELRKQLVDYMQEHLEEIEPYFIANNNNSYTNTFSRIEALREDGLWDNNDGDIISQVAADAFNVNINIYDVKEQRSRFIINKIQFHKDYDKEIDILRINDGHYELLVPKNNNNSNNKNKNKNKNKSKNNRTKKNKKHTYRQNAENAENAENIKSHNHSPNNSNNTPMKQLNNMLLDESKITFTNPQIADMLKELGALDKYELTESKLLRKTKAEMMSMYADLRGEVLDLKRIIRQSRINK